MAANKTVETDADVAAVVAAVADPAQRADAEVLIRMMAKVSGYPPKMWGPSIIGFGQYHYHYDSGREGDMCRVGFSPRKGQTVVYIVDGFPGHTELLARLGKHKTGKSCLYIKRLADVDLSVLADLVTASLAVMAERHPG
jgi:Domain of unknown function (DU1801)